MVLSSTYEKCIVLLIELYDCLKGDNALFALAEPLPCLKKYTDLCDINKMTMNIELNMSGCFIWICKVHDFSTDILNLTDEEIPAFKYVDFAGSTNLNVEKLFGTLVPVRKEDQTHHYCTIHHMPVLRKISLYY